MLADQLQTRRRTLGMTYAVIARRSGIPVATVERILSSRPHRASLGDVVAIAAVLGMALELREEAEPVDMIHRQAKDKARRLVGLVQGTSLLEAQGVDQEHRQQMEQDTTLELLRRPRRQLWSDA